MILTVCAKLDLSSLLAEPKVSRGSKLALRSSTSFNESIFFAEKRGVTQIGFMKTTFLSDKD